MTHLLLIEDDPEIGPWLRDDLQRRGYAVTWRPSGEGAAAQLSRADLVILDVMLPGLDGFSVAQRLKHAAPALPILFLSARTALDDKLQGLALADDYLTKPFHPDELAARVALLLRRHAAPTAQAIPLHHLDVFLAAGRVVERASGRELTLTRREFQLLTCFLRHPNQVLTKDQLLDAVWGPAFLDSGENTLMVHIRQLRTKIEVNPGDPHILQTIRGLGYRLCV